MLSGWMRFGPAEKGDVDGEEGEGSEEGGVGVLPLPWTVLLSNPPRINTPLPPMSANIGNLPLQLLLAETVMEVLEMTADGGCNSAAGGSPFVDLEVALTSLVRREDLYRAFPTHFGPWRLDALSDLTPREALCRVQGLESVALRR
jgi:hypothetical protein